MAEAFTAESQPYPWPWHGHFNPARTALLVVRDGDLAPPGPATAPLLCSVTERAAHIGVLVADLPRCVGRPAAASYGADFQLARPHWGAFSGTDLDFTLRRRGISDLILAGFPFELGADSTMRQANDLGYECLALTDCCTGLSEETLAGAFSSIQMSGGIFGAVASSAAMLTLFANAGAPGRPTEADHDAH